MLDALIAWPFGKNYPALNGFTFAALVFSPFIVGLIAIVMVTS